MEYRKIVPFKIYTREQLENMFKDVVPLIKHSDAIALGRYLRKSMMTQCITGWNSIDGTSRQTKTYGFTTIFNIRIPDFNWDLEECIGNDKKLLTFIVNKLLFAFEHGKTLKRDELFFPVVYSKDRRY